MRRILVVFTRNFHLEGNKIFEAKENDIFIPVFIKDYLDHFEEGSNPRDFLLAVLKNFSRQLKSRKTRLLIITLNELKEIITHHNINEVRIQFDVYPKYQKLVGVIKEVCNETKASFKLINDFLTDYSGEVKISTFRNFYEKYFLKQMDLNINSFPLNKLIEDNSANSYFEFIHRKKFDFPSNEEEARKSIEGFTADRIYQYKSCRDFPALDCTSHSSISTRHGLISYKYLLLKTYKVEPFVREIAWGEFNRQAMYQFPFAEELEINKSWRRFPWETNSVFLKKWQLGETGFPIVDAGIRELNETGFMHNRVRMIVASFLAKNLLIDWREGARYFKEQLLDYDPSQNSLNWQWVAGCGLDAALYFRIFNPLIQARKYDQEGTYIKRWVPELKHETAENILNLNIETKTYPKPLVDIKETASRFLILARTFLRKEQKE